MVIMFENVWENVLGREFTSLSSGAVNGVKNSCAVSPVPSDTMFDALITLEASMYPFASGKKSGCAISPITII